MNYEIYPGSVNKKQLVFFININILICQVLLYCIIQRIAVVKQTLYNCKLLLLYNECSRLHGYNELMLVPLRKYLTTFSVTQHK